MARTNNLKDFLTDVANAIRTKKGTTELIPANTFDTEIESISGYPAMYSPRYINFYRYGGTELNDEISSLNTSNITSMAYMFYNCTNLISLDLSNFNTSNVTDMDFMFDSCTSLSSINISSFDTSKVTNMEQMFEESKATTGYARTQEDANRLNDSWFKPSALTFVVKSQ